MKMFINNKDYRTDMVDIQSLRYLLFLNLYGSEVIIESLSNIISKHIDCLNIEYCPSSYTFTIKIKKTAMRKYHGFDHDPKYYYTIIPSIFKEFIQTNANYVSKALEAKYPIREIPLIMDKLINSDYYCLANMCHISCIADNILIMKL